MMERFSCAGWPSPATARALPWLRATAQASTSARIRKPADTSSKAGVPSGFASTEASHGPKMAPRVPPTEIKAKKRLLCSRENRSAISAQNSMVANRLNTLNQT